MALKNGLVRETDVLDEVPIGDLRGADMTGKNLSAADLRYICAKGAVFRGADLSYAKLAGADLAGSVLALSTLDDAELCYANLDGAELSGSSMLRCNLDNASLRDADLSSIDLTGGRMCNSFCPDAKLYGAKLVDATLYHARFLNAVLRTANLRGADLCNSILIGADLSDCDLSNVRFCHADMRGAVLESSILTGANLDGAVMSGAFLGRATGLEPSGTWLARNLKKTEEGYIAYTIIPDNLDGWNDYLGYSAIPKKARWDGVDDSEGPVLEPGSELQDVVNYDRCSSSSSGVRLGTLDWIMNKSKDGSGDVWEVLIRWADLADVVVPFNSPGKFVAHRVFLVGLYG